MTRAKLTRKTHRRGFGFGTATHHTAFVDGQIVGEWATGSFGWVGPNRTFCFYYADWRSELIRQYPAEVAA